MKSKGYNVIKICNAIFAIMVFDHFFINNRDNLIVFVNISLYFQNRKKSDLGVLNKLTLCIPISLIDR